MSHLFHFHSHPHFLQACVLKSSPNIDTHQPTFPPIYLPQVHGCHVYQLVMAHTKHWLKKEKKEKKEKGFFIFHLRLSMILSFSS